MAQHPLATDQFGNPFSDSSFASQSSGDNGFFSLDTLGLENANQFTPVLTSLLGVIGTGYDINRKNEVLKENFQNQADVLEIKQGQKGQQLQDLDRVLSDKLSASGLEALKTESKLKAASAETGATGVSNTEAIQTAEISRLQRDSALFRIADVQKANKFSEIIADRLNFENVTEGMLTGQQSAVSAGLQTLGSGLRGVNQGLGFLGSADRDRFFGTNTTGGV